MHAQACIPAVQPMASHCHVIAAKKYLTSERG